MLHIFMKSRNVVRILHCDQFAVTYVSREMYEDRVAEELTRVSYKTTSGDLVNKLLINVVCFSDCKCSYVGLFLTSKLDTESWFCSWYFDERNFSTYIGPITK